MVHKLGSLQCQPVCDIFGQTKQSVYVNEFFLGLRMKELGRSTHAIVSGLSIEAEIGEPLRVPAHHPVGFLGVPNLFAICPSTTASIKFGLRGRPFTKCDDCYREWLTVVVPLEAEGNPSES